MTKPSPDRKLETCTVDADLPMLTPRPLSAYTAATGSGRRRSDSRAAGKLYASIHRYRRRSSSVPLGS
jgi:hypothetical protein